MNEDSGRQKIKYWRKGKFDENEEVFNTTTILGMVVMSVETRIETMGTDYRSERAEDYREEHCF